MGKEPGGVVVCSRVSTLQGQDFPWDVKEGVVVFADPWESCGFPPREEKAFVGPQM